MINFIAGGMMGDFIHSLYVVKHICNSRNEKANLLIAEGHGDVWRFNLQKTYDDLVGLMNLQEYIGNFGILDPSSFKEEAINLTDWRKNLDHTPETGYLKCWTEVLSNCYNFAIPTDYSWLTAGTNNLAQNKILIHRSTHRINGNFPWKNIIDNIHEDILFLCSNEKEWENFQFKNSKITVLKVNTITEMANSINSCKLFIGNQSAPFTIACGLDKQRLVELDSDPAGFYMDENKYSDKISWFLNQNKKFNSSKSAIII